MTTTKIKEVFEVSENYTEGNETKTVTLIIDIDVKTKTYRIFNEGRLDFFFESGKSFSELLTILLCLKNAIGIIEDILSK